MSFRGPSCRAAREYIIGSAMAGGPPHSRAIAHHPEAAAVRVVLVRPEHAANIGAVARIARNTGVAGLDLVSAGDWRSVECWRTAWGATELLEEARVHADLAAALAGSQYVVALSRRSADGVTRDIREVALEIAALPADTRVSLVFGPETHGLALDELALCGRVAAIPSHPGQPSLNLSHAVMVAAYEVFRATSDAAPRTHDTLATHEEKERALATLFDGLRAMHALSDAERGVYARLWRNLLQRADLSPREARLIAHMGRKLARLGKPHAPRKPASEPLPARAAVTVAAEEPPYIDVEITPEGFSSPLLKWRELLFTGALKRDGEAYVRDPSRPLPPFARADLFPDEAHFAAAVSAGRVTLTRR
jgi:tRNA (cytidine32/uridine32-2'-O)-methyltransferase